MIDRLFDDSFLHPVSAFAPEGTLALDIAEGDDAYTVKASLPGMKPEEVQITADGNTITIRGASKSEEEKTEKDYVIKERREGKYSRTFTLPAAVDADAAQERASQTDPCRRGRPRSYLRERSEIADRESIKRSYQWTA